MSLKILKPRLKPFTYSLFRFQSTEQKENDKEIEYEEEEFRKIDIFPPKKNLVLNVQRTKRTYHSDKVMGPRYKKMSTKQEWSNVWPSMRSFHPASVPLPLFQGYVKPNKNLAPPGKWSNTELMKIPNFLHLAPPAIKKHCETLKRFCTSWPKGLESEERCDQHFPVKITSTSICHSAVTIRQPKARVIILEVPLDKLQLNCHARDKMIRLLQHRYNPETNSLTIVADRCPLRKQNYDYAHYLLTALFYESWKTEIWEGEKEMSDWEKFYWEKSPSRKAIINYMKRVSDSKEEDLLSNVKVECYAKAVTDLYDKGETAETVKGYKEAVLQLMFN